MTTIFYDCETFNETPINYGVHRYAQTVEVMLEQWAIDDGPVQIADRTAGEEGPWSMFDPEDFDTIVIHNSSFDRTVVRHALGVDIPLERIHDTLVQAMSHGLPIVTTRIGGNPEVVTDGEHGLLVPIEDPDALAAALARFAGDPELRRKLGEAGRQRVAKEFSFSEMTRKYEAIYDRLVAP